LPDISPEPEDIMLYQCNCNEHSYYASSNGRSYTRRD